MTKVIVLSFITLEGVQQAPGGPEENASSGYNLWQDGINFKWDKDVITFCVGNLEIGQNFTCTKNGPRSDTILGRNCCQYKSFKLCAGKIISELQKTILSATIADADGKILPSSVGI